MTISNEEFVPDFEDFGLDENETEHAANSQSIAPDSMPAEEFLPWHKPRKQWIRDRQWWGQIERHILPNMPGTNNLRYFGLPGGDLLDVMFLQQKLSLFEKNVFVMGLINSDAAWESAQKQLSKALDSSGLHKDSRVEKLDFDHLESASSLAYQKMQKVGYFDVVNLDFCGNIIAPSLKSRRLDAIQNLLQYQFQVVPNKWLLFLTTRTSKASSCLNTFERLVQVLEENLTIDEFSEAFKGLYGDLTTESARVNEMGAKADQDFIDIYTLAVFKLIVGFSFPRNFKIKLDSCVRYHIEGEGADSDMVSISLVFTRVLSLPDGSTAEPHLTECALAVRGLNKLRNMRSVDKIITEDPVSYVSCVQQKMALLSQAGRSVERYFDEMCLKDLAALGMGAEDLRAMIAAG